MKRSTYLLLLGAAVAVSAALTGCHGSCGCARSRMSVHDQEPPLAAVPVMTSPYAAVHTPPAIASLPVSTTPAVIETVDLQPPVPAEPVQPVAAQEAENPERLRGYGLQPRNLAGQRRTFGDITARPGFGHAPDHSWVTGELDYLHSRQVWRVRYASVDEDDRYGGSVTLLEPGPMDSFRAGQMVRVSGRVLDIESREVSPAYRVSAIEPFEER